MEFLTLDRASFEYGKPTAVLPGVERVVAQNPSKFTYHGTGTYLIGGQDVVVVDPGPRLDAHRDALAAALAGRRVHAILVTHCHADHSPLAAWLRAETGAPTFCSGPHPDRSVDLGALPDDFGRPAEPPDESAADEPTGDAEPKVEESTDLAFTPDHAVGTGDVVVSAGDVEIEALHTPGHTSNHTCYVLRDGGRTVLFPGDHVMGWSTTVVSPPDGDMAAYLASLQVAADLGADVAVPTHGPPIDRPTEFVGRLIEHRLAREAAVLSVVRRAPATIPAIVSELYADVRLELHRPAASSVLAHLVKLVDDGLVAADTDRPRFDSTYGAV